MKSCSLYLRLLPTLGPGLRRDSHGEGVYWGD